MKAEQACNGLYPVAAAITVEDGDDNYNSYNMVTNFTRWK